MKINVVGLGYIGLPTAVAFANAGFEVAGTDCSEAVVKSLSSRRLTFEERGLSPLFLKAVKSGRLTFSQTYSDDAEIYVISVPTPYDGFSKKVDPSYVISAVKSVVEVCREGSVIVIESTVSPGTTEGSIKPLITKKVSLAHAPERIIPGNMIYELRHNSRIIGAEDEATGERIAEIYRKTTDGEVVVTDIKSAEMAKVAENTFRAVNIAFANELAKICNHDGLSVYEIIRLCNMHPRVNILSPGPGVGGHCIPVDPWFLVGDYPELTKVIGNSLYVNASMPDYVLKLAGEIMEEKGVTDYKRVGIYGLTYKENVDDFRESPTLQFLKAQREHLAEPLKVYDPYVTEDIVENQYHDLDEFLADVDFVIIMVKHDEIKEKMSKLADKIVFDTQNICNLPNVYKL